MYSHLLRKRLLKNRFKFGFNSIKSFPSYFESCTMISPPGETRSGYWCPVRSGTHHDLGFTNYTMGDQWGYCTDYLKPEDNGCQDHYERVKRKQKKIPRMIFCQGWEISNEIRMLYI